MRNVTKQKRSLSEQSESSVEAPVVDVEAAKAYAAWKRKAGVSTHEPVSPLSAWLAERERLEGLVERMQERYDSAPDRGHKRRAERRLDAAEAALFRHFEFGDETLPGDSIEAAYWARVERQNANSPNDTGDDF